MPCDIGYKSYSRVKIATPQVQTLKITAKAPSVDADLLDRVGVDDPAFLAWMQEIDTQPLLQRALDAALVAVNK